MIFGFEQSPSVTKDIRSVKQAICLDSYDNMKIHTWAFFMTQTTLQRRTEGLVLG
jgi:hypothetical protein